MSPKPILKRSVTNAHEQHRSPYHHQHPIPYHHQHHQSHGVHFPPSPSLTRTFSAYSASAYDRSPIVVSPNNCALPERGCPGRTYTIEESAGSPSSPRGISYAKDYHPRALSFASARSTRGDPAANYPAVPQLIPDLSSESEESDGFNVPCEPSTTSYPTFGIYGLAGPSSYPSVPRYGNTAPSNTNMNAYTACDDDSAALAFLPYAPSSPMNVAFGPSTPPSSVQYQYEDSDDLSQKPRRRRGERERRHESSRDPDRIPSSGGSNTQSFPSVCPPLSISSTPSYSPPPSPTNSRKRSSKRHSPTYPASSGFGVADDGCLGGF
ncbi:hypothetical protein B0H34DRAFT_720518 [Crassisporium funariophilum]|nr:hypothetical protein B0H34DRAFT_720518 [Crassisporium funariophilum]